MKYAVVIEQTDTGFSAYVPDLPGCVTTGQSRTEIERNMQEALSLHLQGLRAEGQPLPLPGEHVLFIEAA